MAEIAATRLVRSCDEDILAPDVAVGSTPPLPEDDSDEEPEAPLALAFAPVTLTETDVVVITEVEMGGEYWVICRLVWMVTLGRAVESTMVVVDAGEVAGELTGEIGLRDIR
jgi:hypothetical protein